MSVEYGNIEIIHLDNQGFKILLFPKKRKYYFSIQATLLSLFFLFAITPILLLVLLFGYFGITLGFFISTALSWACAVYFGRRYLWERYGRECFVISDNKIEQIIDYGMFEDRLNTHNFNLIDVGYSFTSDGEEFFFFDNEVKDEIICFVCFISETDVIISQVETPYKHALSFHDYFNGNLK